METRLTYDAADQLTTAQTGDYRVDYSYDPVGRLTGQTDGAQQWSIGYGGFGLPAVTTHTHGKTTQTQRATYNGDNLLVGLDASTGYEDVPVALPPLATRYRWSLTDEVPQVLSQRSGFGYEPSGWGGPDRPRFGYRGEIGEPEQWLPGGPDRDTVRRRGRELLAGCLP
ncbi:MAG: hypothetical protein HKP61_14060 [Dactylosporangium sp.]|nr:hypothetical protein [Dactylosporangium sp.]